MKVLLLVMMFCSGLGFASGIQDSGQRIPVRVGIHNNGGGSSLAAVALECGFFAKYGIDPIFTIVESGKTEMVAMRANRRSLDIGYIGTGAIWNALDASGNSVSLVFFDNFSNSENLLARKGLFSDISGNGLRDKETLFNGLKGKIVYMEYNTSSEVWFRQLIDILNDGHPVSQKIWIDFDGKNKFPAYHPPNTNVKNKVSVVQMQNSRLPEALATGKIDIAVCYAPMAQEYYAVAADITESIASSVTEIFLSEQKFLSAWIASDAWLESNRRLAQNFINALYEAALWRAVHPSEAMRAAERLCGKQTGTFDVTDLEMFTQSEYEWYFAESEGCEYIRSLYANARKLLPEAVPVKPFDKVCDKTLMINAILNNKNS